MGIIGPKEAFAKNRIQIILKRLKEQFGSQLEIISGGNKTGIEYETKKVVLEMNLNYKEFNPSYSGFNMYSALNEEYYEKKFHPTHESDRYRRLVRTCNRLIIFNDGQDKEILGAKRYAEKNGKKFVEIEV